MTLKQLLLSVLFASLVCWLTWALVLFQVDPTSGGLIGFAVFYISLFFALLGTFFLTGFGVRKLYDKSELEYKVVSTSLRQATFFALLMIFVLFLQSKDLLSWWNIILLILGLGVLEFFFLSYRRNNL